MATQRRSAPSHGRERLEWLIPWLAAAVNLAYGLPAGVRTRLLPAAATAARAVAAGIDRAEARFVPLLAALGRAAAVATGACVHFLALAVQAAARPLALATGACVDAVAGAAARHGPRAWRFLRPGVRRAGAGAGVTLLVISVVLALGLAASGPALELVAKTMYGDLRAAQHRGLPPLEEPSVVVAADGTVLAELHAGIDRQVVALERVPVHVRDAVIAAEDRRFYEHDGYDLAAIGRALLVNVRAGEVTQGGSTITQQLAKQNYVGGDQTVRRKLGEVVHAVALEERFAKDELLERYLNQVYFGAGAYGVAAAAWEFFRVAPEDLTVAQGALLAGLIRSPVALDPRRNPDGARDRRDDVLAAMATLDLLPAELAVALSAEPPQVAPPAPPAPAQPFVVEAVRREFLANPAFGVTETERAGLLYTGGLRIETTVDPRLQAAAAEAIAAHTRSDGPTAAVAAVEPASGRIRALDSGADFARVRFDLVTQGRRQPGSAFKPLVAAAALEAGWPPSRTLPGDGPLRLDVPGQPEPWLVDNSRGADHGAVTLREALAGSVNTAFAELGAAVGTGRIVDVAWRLGIDVDEAFGPPSSRGPAVALGGLTYGVSPLEMAAAYATFANRGVHTRPYLIERVLGGDGRPLHGHRPQVAPALDPVVNATLVDLLQEVVRSGTGTGAQLSGWQPAGKTGTTQDGADGWFVGAVPLLSTAVWVGHPEARRPVPGLAGGAQPAAIWRAFMARALDGVAPVGF